MLIIKVQIYSFKKSILNKVNLETDVRPSDNIKMQSKNKFRALTSTLIDIVYNIVGAAITVSLALFYLILPLLVFAQ